MSDLGYRPFDCDNHYYEARAAYDFLITLVFDRLFERFPNLRVASIENGSEFLPDMFKKLRSTMHKFPGYFKERSGPHRHLQAECLDQSLLGRRRLRSGAVHGRRSRDLRIQRAPHRGHARAALLCVGTGEVRRRHQAKNPAR